MPFVEFQARILFNPRESIFLTDRDDGSLRVKILDFGISKLLASDASIATSKEGLLGLTAAGLPVGMQIIGAEGEDLTTIEFARLLGAEIGGFLAPPDPLAARRSLVRVGNGREIRNCRPSGLATSVSRSVRE